MDKLIITAAICGAEVTKEQNPNVPYTVEEIVREAKSAVDAGAAIVHLHVRWDDGTPTQDRGRFQECEEAILKVCPNVILIPSTGGAVGMTPDERLQSTDTNPLPEMATLDCGTCNFGDEIFDNTMPTMRWVTSTPSSTWPRRVRPLALPCSSTSCWACPAALPPPSPTSAGS